MPRSTSTSRFGVSRRENHDASAFYARFTPPHLSADTSVHPFKAIDEIVCGDARSMSRVPDASVALVVTSPPYFAGKEYEEALGVGHVPATYLEYLTMLEDVFTECVRTLEPGGRIAVNVANLGRRPFRSLSADVTTILQDRLRLLLRGEIIWQKARGSTGSCAWGSFQRPANPVLRDLTERVIVASKGRFDRALSPRERVTRGLPSVASISKDEFMEATTDVWEIPAESATRAGHPAPFPVALPERLIHLHTYYGDLVLDPFMGSGSTAVAAVRTGRHHVGYDTDPAYVRRARARVAQESVRPAAGIRVVLPGGAEGSGDPVSRALQEGRSAVEVARSLLESCGFSQIESGVRVGRIEVSLRALDRRGRRWLFEVLGGFTVAPLGAGALWRALGKAAAVHQELGVGMVLLAAGSPADGSAGGALRAVLGSGKPVAALVELRSGRAAVELRSLAEA